MRAIRERGHRLNSANISAFVKRPKEYDGPSYNRSMKVTPLIPDKLIAQVHTHAKGKNLTESLLKALGEWSDLQKIRQLNQVVAKRPLKFNGAFYATRVRNPFRGH